METTQSTQKQNARVQDLELWYDERQKKHFLFCSIDGMERDGRPVPDYLAAKVRDGKMTLDELAKRMFPGAGEGKENTFFKDMEKEAEKMEQDQTQKSAGRRFLDTSFNLLKNYAHNAEKFGAWVSDIFTLAWNDDNIGAYKEFAKGVAYAENLVGKTLDFFHVEDLIAKARSYMLDAYTAGGYLLRGDMKKAGIALAPMGRDISNLFRNTFINSGLWQFVKNTGERVPMAFRAVGNFFTGRWRAAGNTGKEILAGTVGDAREVIRSKPVQAAVQTVLNGMERLDSATKADDIRQQIQNRMREEDLTMTHPRLSAVRIYCNNSGMNHYIRCKIDGVQQMGKPLKEQDFTNWELGGTDRFGLAEKYYAKDLELGMEQSRAMTR